MATPFAGELAGSRGVHEVQSIRLVGSDVAVVVSWGAMPLAGQTEPDAAKRCDTLLRVRHGCRVAP